LPPSNQQSDLQKTIGATTVSTGCLVYRYANQIFSLGQELRDSIKRQTTGQPIRLVVGIADALPKLIAYCILEPAFARPEPIQVISMKV